jgi:hypothetical protein
VGSGGGRVRGWNERGAAEQFAEKVENYPAMEWNPGRAMEKISASQAFGIDSGFLAQKTGSE